MISFGGTTRAVWVGPDRAGWLGELELAGVSSGCAGAASLRFLDGGCSALPCPGSGSEGRASEGGGGGWTGGTWGFWA